MGDVEYSYGEPGAEFNRAGRIVKVENPDVRAERFYGKLGETVKAIKSFWSHSPPKAWREHTTEYEFDSFGRMRSLVYPDGEVLTYGYDKGGLVVSATGFKGGTEYPYLKDITYDEFGQRTRLELGNGVVTNYEYDDKTRRLDNILSSNEQGYTLQNMAYSYDLVGNILGTDNAPFMTFNDAPLSVTQEYGYDDLHRLIAAEGQYRTGTDRVDRYLNAFEYDSIGNFSVKDQDHHDYRPSDGSKRERRETTYNYIYKYESSRPHAPTHIGDVTYNYDANGNMTGWDHDRNGQKRRIAWNEENRVESVTDGSTTRFFYDADGTRAMKRGRYGEVIYVNENYAVRNGEIHTKHVFAGNTRLATKLRLMRVQKGNVKTTSSVTGYTTTITATTETTTTQKKQAKSAKFAGTPLTTSVATSSVQETIQYSTVDSADVKGQGKGKGNTKSPSPLVGEGRGEGADTSLPGNSEKGLENALSRGKGTKKGIYRRLDRLGYEVTPEGDIVPAGTEPPPGGGGGGGTPPGGGNGGGGTGGGGKGNDTFEEKAIFYFHADHLGSSTVLTDADGEAYEHMQYFPYGESWVEETKSQIYFPYKFTGKELDPETGLYYFGARYYEPRISVWISTDPALADYLPSLEDKVTARQQNKLYIPEHSLPGIGGIFNSRNLSLYGYTHENPVRYTDPDGRVAWVPLLLVGWAVYEVGSAAYDIYNAGQTLSDPKATTAEKTIAVGGAIISVAGPGGGYGTVGKGIIGFAKGTARSAFTPNRLQHASRHLTDAGLLPNWSKATAEKFVEIGSNILENPKATFDHVLKGGHKVKGFIGEVNGKKVAFMVFKDGPHKGQVATSVVPTAQQLAKWGVD